MSPQNLWDIANELYSVIYDNHHGMGDLDERDYEILDRAAELLKRGKVNSERME